MLKYRSQYRVCYEMDKNGKVCEFTFIPCMIKKGTNICRYDDNTLSVYIPSIQIINRLLKEYPLLFKPHQIGDTEGTLLFSETDIKQADKILKIRTKGKSLSPKNKAHKKFQN